MGVTGLWDILRPSGKLRSLTHVAVVDGFEANPANLRGLRIGIDASIWFFHAAHGREGENPELRTLFFRCAKLTSTPFLPLFIFDGPKRPKVKRGKRISGEKHWLVDSMKGMIEAFGFEWRMAPGEAEAELAYLNSIGIIDAVLSDDVDNFLFGAKMVIRNSSANLSGNSKHATKNADGRVDGNHSTVYTSAEILAHPSVQLTRGGLILIGLLSGGDYHPAGLARCGTGIAHGLAKCGFGDELLKATQSLTRDELPDFLTTWREDLRGELRTNSRGHLGSKKPSLAKAVPDAFPDIDVLLSYTNPIISATDAGARRTHTPPRWEREPDLGKLAHLCELHFEWGLKDTIIKRFRTVLWPSIVLRALRRSTLEAGAAAAPGVRESEPLQDVFGTPSKLLARHFSSMGFGAHNTGDGEGGGLQELIVKIHGERTHAYTDSILEYRLEVAPAQLVHLASAGVQGLRKPADTTYDVLPSESEESGGNTDDEDTGRRKKKRGAGPPPEPDSHLRVWMPACMVCSALPDLVERYEAEVEAKRAKKSSKGKQRVPATKSSSKKKAAKLRTPVDSDAEEFDLNVSCPSDDHKGGGGSSPPSRTLSKAALPAASLDHSQQPDSVRKYPTFSFLGDAQEQILDITTSDDEAAPDPPTKLPLSSPCKVLQTLDMNLNSDVNLFAAAPTVSSPSARKRPPLRPFPMAFEEEESSEDDDGGGGYPLQTSFAAATAFRASTPPPPPRHQPPPMIPKEEEISSDSDPDMVTADLPVLADTRHLFPGREQPRAYPQTTTSIGHGGQQQQHVNSHQTSPRRRPSPYHPFPPPPAKEARKGELEEGRIPRVQGLETSIISISSGGSDSDDDDGLALAPLLIARSRTSVSQKVAATGRDIDREVIDLT